MERSKTNATNVTLHSLRQAIWWHIWKHILDKSHINVTNVTMPPHRQVIWGDIWNRTVGKKQTNATNVTLHPLGHSLWRLIWKSMETSDVSRSVAKMKYMVILIHQHHNHANHDNDNDYETRRQDMPWLYCFIVNPASWILALSGPKGPQTKTPGNPIQRLSIIVQ